jgi:hypothetical protein
LPADFGEGGMGARVTDDSLATDNIGPGRAGNRRAPPEPVGRLARFSGAPPTGRATPFLELPTGWIGAEKVAHARPDADALAVSTTPL